MALLIVVPFWSPRLDYTLDLLFTRILGIPFVCLEQKDFSAVSALNPTLWYGIQGEAGDIVVPDAGLLWEKDMKGPLPERGEGTPPRLHWNRPAREEVQGAWHFDVFSATFFVVSEYSFYLSESRDQHGRYLEEDPLPGLCLGESPVVHHWAAALAEALHARYPALAIAQRTPHYPHRITFDLDQPWKYRFKPLAIQAGGLLRDVLRLDAQRLRERWRSWVFGKDPFDTFHQITHLAAPSCTTFFILLARSHAHDSRFTWRHRRWRRRISWLHELGYEVGIHPSYEASERRGEIEAQALRLKEITGVAPRSSRMHFLRYQLPGTRRELIAAGILEDFTPCRIAGGGFPQGMAIPYPWYDLQADCVTSLMLHPTLLMDRTLLSYLRLSSAEAAMEVDRLWQKCEEVNGAFVVCLHNDALSESEEWRGWSGLFSDLIRRISATRACE